MASPSVVGSCATEWTLADLHSMFQANQPGISNAIRCHVVNYEATNDFPHKFTYEGCAGITEDERMCRRSVRHFPCKQHATDAEVLDMLRFDLILCDGSDCGKPFKATIFSPVAEKFLDFSAQQMVALDDLAQIAYVERQVRTFAMLDGRFSVSSRGVVLQSFTRCFTARVPVSVGRMKLGLEGLGSTSAHATPVKKPPKGSSKPHVDNESILAEAQKLLRSLKFATSEDE